MKFKGGKGVVTTIGVFSYLSLIPLLISLASWPIAFLITKTSSISSLSFVIILPLVLLIMRGPGYLFYLSLVILVVIVIAHIENIKRILNGKENRLK